MQCSRPGYTRVRSPGIPGGDMRAAQWPGYTGGMRMRMRADLQPERLQHAVAHEVHGQGVHALRLQKGSQQSRLCLVLS